MPTVHLLGTCVTHDFALRFKSVFESYGYTVDFSNFSGKPNNKHITPRLSSSIVPPGQIAEMLQAANMHTVKSSQYRYKWWLQFESVIKTFTIEDAFASVNVDDILVMDLHGELYPAFENGDDSFGIYPGWNTIRTMFPAWFTNLVDTFPTYKADMLSGEVLKIRNRRLDECARRLSNIFNNIIVIGSVFTDRIYLPDVAGGAVGKVLPFRDVKGAIPFVTVSSDMSDTQVNMGFLKRLYENLVRGALLHHPNFRSIIPDPELCYTDPHHRWGPYPCHLHRNSMEHLREQLIAQLSDISQPKIITPYERTFNASSYYRC